VSLRAGLRTALPVIAALLLAAHFYRADLLIPAGVALGVGALPFLRHPWAARLLLAGLLLGVAEWLRTAWVLAAHRAEMGLPYVRMLAILGAVAALTALAAWLARPAPSSPD
jgi:hypothetical protein